MPFKLLLIPILSGFLVQLIKLFIRFIREKKISWRYLDDYGGMPSAHAAFLSSLGTVAALSQGINSITFAIIIIIGAIMLRDALGLRMYVEKQGKLLLNLVKRLPSEEKEKLLPKKMNLGERIGHTYPEAIVGFILGIAFAFLFYYLF
ncbi:MAG: divergent PAP2 family protein [Patescibacteria group bacterium]